MSEPPLLEVSNLVKAYRLAGVGPFSRKSTRPALTGVSFSISRGRSFRRRRRIRIWKVDPGAYSTGARPPRFPLRAPRGTLAIRFAATRIARAARTYANGLPGPVRFARSAPARRKDRRRTAGGVGRSEQGRAPRARSSSRSRRSASRRRTPRSTRMNFPAVSGNASPSRGRSLRGRNSSSPTNRCRRSTFRCRRRL